MYLAGNVYNELQRDGCQNVQCFVEIGLRDFDTRVYAQGEMAHRRNGRCAGLLVRVKALCASPIRLPFALRVFREAFAPRRATP